MRFLCLTHLSAVLLIYRELLFNTIPISTGQNLNSPSIYICHTTPGRGATRRHTHVQSGDVCFVHMVHMMHNNCVHFNKCHEKGSWERAARWLTSLQRVSVLRVCVRCARAATLQPDITIDCQTISLCLRVTCAWSLEYWLRRVHIFLFDLDGMSRYSFLCPVRVFCDIKIHRNRSDAFKAMIL